MATRRTPRHPAPRPRDPALGVHQRLVTTTLGGGASLATTTLTAGTFAPAGDGSAPSTQTLTARTAASALIPGASVTNIRCRQRVVSAALSSVAAAPGTIANDGVASSTITTTITNTVSDPVVGLPAASNVLAATGAGNTLTQTTGATNYLGSASGSLVSTTAATKVASTTAAGLAVTDTASIVVSENDVAVAPNEPASFTLLADTTWSTLSPQPSGWYAGDSADFPNKQPSIQSESGPFLGTSYRVRWTNEQTDGYGSFMYPTTMPDAVEYFYAFCFKTSSAWVNESSGTKIIYPRAENDAGFIVSIITNGAVDSGTYKWQGSTQPGDESNTNLPQNINAGYTCTNDTWYRVEVQTVRGTPGSNDGIFRVWLSAWNGSAFETPVLVTEYTNVRYIATGGAAYWDRPEWIFYRGGAGTPTLAADQYVYLNRTYVSYKVA